MTKLCPRGKAAAKRKFRVYPSAYANAYASKICAGKIKDPSGVKRKDFRGRKPAAEGGPMDKDDKKKKENSIELIKKRKESKQEVLEKMKKELGLKVGGRVMKKDGDLVMGPKRREQVLKRRKEKLDGPRKGQPVSKRPLPIRGSLRVEKMGGGLMEATQRLRRQGLKAGGRGCKLAMKGRGRAYGKNS
jgi:hypothetical protein